MDMRALQGMLRLLLQSHLLILVGRLSREFQGGPLHPGVPRMVRASLVPRMVRASLVPRMVRASLWTLWGLGSPAPRRWRLQGGQEGQGTRACREGLGALAHHWSTR
jgi:hypothetical protein